MSIRVRFRRMVGDLLRRRRFEQELDEELQHFVELDRQRLIETGRTDGEAGRLARASLGLEATKERVRGQRFGEWAASWWRDLSYGARLLRRAPLFSTVVGLTLALGIGANVAVYSVVSSVVLQPLPFPESGRLVRLLSVQTRADGQSQTTAVAPRLFAAVEEGSSLIDGIVAQRFHSATTSGDGEPERIVGIGVTEQWSEVLGVKPALGRSFDRSELASGSAAGVVILSDRFWRTRFAGVPDVLGRDLVIDQERHVVIGVMPKGFVYPYHTDVWMPMSLDRSLLAPGDLNVAARMRAGVGIGQLQTELDVLAAEATRLSGAARGTGIVARPFEREFRRDPNRSIAVLATAVAFLLLLVCVNVANLWLVRSGARRREVAVRTALGAGRLRQLRQLFTEVLLLVGVAAAGGSVLALLSTRWLGVLIPSRLGEVVSEVRPEAGAVWIAIVLTLGVALLSGLAPAWQVTRSGPGDALRSGGRSGELGSGVLDLMVVAQVALALVLLVATTTSGHAFLERVRAEPGYEPDGLLRLEVGLPQPRFGEPERRVALASRLSEALGAVPGVVGAGFTTLHPVPGTNENVLTRLDAGGVEDSGEPLPVVNLRLVTPGYLEAVGVPLLGGRLIEARDRADTRAVVVVSESAAERFWPGGHALGASVRIGRGLGGDRQERIVVGVVGDLAEPDADEPETVYQPYAQGTAAQAAGTWSTTRLSLLVRAANVTPELSSAVRAAIRAVDPQLPLYDVAPMPVVLAEPLRGQRLGTLTLLGFSVFGLLLAALGTYGVLALGVARRGRELALRVALGACPKGLRRRIVLRGLRLVAIGLVLGVLGVIGLGRALPVVGIEVDVDELALLAAPLGTLLLVGVVASWVPARRVTRVDPCQVLRAE